MKLALILLCAAAPGWYPAHAVAGTIEGTVVNTSSGASVPCRVEVALHVQVHHEFVPFQETISDAQGRFRFQRLPVDDGVVYQVGATRHGVFYPGPRIPLNELQPIARAQLSVCDAVAGPSPLRLERMDVVIRPESGLLKVTESLLVDNPSHTCYVGQADSQGADPVTLELSIPPDFERTTFDQEFFGRRFAVFNHKLVTNVPWTPGQRELRYTYIVRNTQKVSHWKRTVDLPCTNVTVRVEGVPPDEVRCGMLRRTVADENSVTFESAGQEIAAGQVLQVDLGRLPLPWMTYGRWVAVAIMLGLIAVGGWLHFHRGDQQSSAKMPVKSLAARATRKRAA